MRKVYISRSVDPRFNLAVEEYLVRCRKIDDEILYLWQNQNTVVIGRNQNPWKECDLEELTRRGCHLVRRLSGGGAVYHDLGNLNFTFISALEEGKIRENIALIINALTRNKIPAVFSGKNDITVQDCKVSGNAFYVEDDILCHHGTLLVDTDSDQLNRILTVSQSKLQSKGVDSVKARVKNLNEFNSLISIESLMADLVDEFIPADGNAPAAMFIDESTNIESINIDDVQQLMKRYDSWEWNFGSSPEFNLQISKRFPWGEVELYLLVNDGVIVEAEVSTDALDTKLPQKIKDIIHNKKFNEEKLFSLIAASIVEMSPQM